jgi:hypothetical protein
MAESVAINRLPLLIAAGVAGVLVVGTSILWMRYGTAVFFEMVRAGFVACFG